MVNLATTDILVTYSLVFGTYILVHCLLAPFVLALMYDQGFDGQWGAGAGDAPAPPEAPTEPQPQVNQPQTQLPSAEAQHIHTLLEAVVAIGAGQQAFMDNKTRYGLALEALTRHLDNTTLGSSQSNSQLCLRGVKTRDPRMFNGCLTEVVSFLREIRAYIDLQQDPNLIKSSLMAIENLKQTGAAADYANKFQEHLVHLDLSMFTQITYFDHGLKPSLKLVLVNTPRPATLDGWIATVVEADNRLHEYEREQKSLTKAAGKQPAPHNDHHASPVVTTQTTMQTVAPVATSSHPNIVLMEIDAMCCGPIMAEEKEHCCKNGLCFYCGQGKHLARDCPNMSE
ncbi:hypothetical protein POSPLADRAFT_1047972 [Postia placenta MAD-698-R-SB12]|uniref:CCHC-type domain-containing protein n=1 Tax=Postia placenta MAD-698-R-SB12 TaxID=670580 RepID=A0A1X6MWG7_9APHY|nr:hypothetical protein POSPLADRAFT_1047972 [Postia placenta MAD-698-R-SB12]OSX60553.1 hypothetical protein POSPLADRAFT_1047972 [Postia placenta MAD-698-R-SB12]